MKYSFVPLPDNAPKSVVGFPHEQEISIKGQRHTELHDFLTEHFGKKHQAWRADNINRPWRAQGKVRIRFQDKESAMRFKLSWIEDEEPPILAFLPGGKSICYSMSIRYSMSTTVRLK